MPNFPPYGMFAFALKVAAHLIESFTANSQDNVMCMADLLVALCKIHLLGPNHPLACSLGQVSEGFL